MIETKTRKTKWGYRGYVECWDVDTLGVTRHPGSKFKIWSEVAGPHRVYREDALEDANNLKKWRDPIYS